MKKLTEIWERIARACIKANADPLRKRDLEIIRQKTAVAIGRQERARANKGRYRG